MVVPWREAKYVIDYLIAFNNRLLKLDQNTAKLFTLRRAALNPLFFANIHSVDQARPDPNYVSSLSAAAKMGRLWTDFPFDIPRLA